MGGKPVQGRMTSDGDGEVVIFLVGMRINNWRAVRSWLPVFLAMPRMIKELARDRDSGMLGHRLLPGLPRHFAVIQYWESKEKLQAYAMDQSGEHRPAWAAFNRRAREGKDKVGFWHETFVVPAGAHKSIYINMPSFGLGEALGAVPVGRRREPSADRMAV
ncbi:DUF4188 domain-containing protein [Streptomyces inhibens]|uniref:DUF4188 domain-containing protein n=1 Tax=Streptomyces inhibens TaxID=2293571 RepID=UPI00379F8DA6